MKKANLLLKITLVLLAVLVVLSALPYAFVLSSADHFDATSGVPQAGWPYTNSAYFKVDQSFIHYRIFEPSISSSPPQKIQNMLLIHGFGGSSYSFEAAIPALTAGGFRVVAVDLPGFGYSSRNTQENHAQVHRAALLWQLIASLNTREPWHLVGHSMGGGTAAAMAIQDPQNTASLSLVDGALFDPPAKGVSITSYAPLVRWVQVALEYGFISPKNIEKTLKSAYATAPSEGQIQGYYGPLALRGTAKSAATLLKTSKGLTESAIASIETPTLGIWGSSDTWVPLEQATRLEALMPNFKLVVIEGAGHCAMETHTPIFVDTLIDFIQPFSK